MTTSTVESAHRCRSSFAVDFFAKNACFSDQGGSAPATGGRCCTTIAIVSDSMSRYRRNLPSSPRTLTAATVPSKSCSRRLIVRSSVRVSESCEQTWPHGGSSPMLTRVQRTCLPAAPSSKGLPDERISNRRFRRTGDALALSIVAVPTRACEPEIALIPARAASLAAPVGGIVAA
jgi:hypothetical protein